MLKNIIKTLLKNEGINNIDYVSEINKYHALPILLDMRIFAYWIVFFILSAILINKGRTCQLFGVGIIILYSIYAMLEIVHRGPLTKTKYQIRTLKLTEFIMRYFVTLKGAVISKAEWRKIKKKDKYFFQDITSDECNHKCYYYARELALIIKDVKLMYVSICDYAHDNEKYAHAIIRRDNKIYDTNLRRTFNLDKYTKLCGMEIYKEWNYEEYSKIDFYKCVKEDFVSWCNKNNVIGYEYF